MLCEAEVLLDQHGGVAALFQLPDHAAQRLHDDGRQAFGDFVQQQQAGAGAQDARHRQHLLFAARQPRAGAVRAFFQIGEHRVDLFNRHPAGAHRGQQHEVFLGAQRRVDAAFFGAIADAPARDLVGGHAHRFLPLDLDRTAAAAHQAQDGFQRRAAARAVAAQQRHAFAGLHVQVDAVQDVRFAVPGVQVADFQHVRGGAGHGFIHLRLPCRLRARRGLPTRSRRGLRPGSRPAAKR
ncbi:hypothetical protein D3C71_1383110 [compost metagenome]